MIDNAFIETEPRLHDLLQARVIHQVVILKRLLDH